MAREPRLWRWLMKVVLRRHRPVKSFEHELGAGGGLAARAEAGTQPVPVEKIVGSVGRAHTLRSDFFHRHGRTMTYRYRRIGELMQQGAPLPPVDLYRLRRKRAGVGDAPVSEYYVLDGHHRVAMARRRGQVYLDAAIVEYQVAADRPEQADVPMDAELGSDGPPAPSGDAPDVTQSDPDETTHG